MPLLWRGKWASGKPQSVCVRFSPVSSLICRRIVPQVSPDEYRFFAEFRKYYRFFVLPVRFSPGFHPDHPTASILNRGSPQWSWTAMRTFQRVRRRQVRAQRDFSSSGDFNAVLSAPAL